MDNKNVESKEKLIDILNYLENNKDNACGEKFEKYLKTLRRTTFNNDDISLLNSEYKNSYAHYVLYFNNRSSTMSQLHFYKSLLGGNPNALRDFATDLYNEDNNDEAFKYFLMASKKRLVYASYDVAYMYIKGIGTEKDEKKGLEIMDYVFNYYTSLNICPTEVFETLTEIYVNMKNNKKAKSCIEYLTRHHGEKIYEGELVDFYKKYIGLLSVGIQLQFYIVLKMCKERDELLAENKITDIMNVPELFTDYNKMDTLYENLGDFYYNDISNLYKLSYKRLALECYKKIKSPSGYLLYKIKKLEDDKELEGIKEDGESFPNCIVIQSKYLHYNSNDELESSYDRTPAGSFLIKGGNFDMNMLIPVKHVYHSTSGQLIQRIWYPKKKTERIINLLNMADKDLHDDLRITCAWFQHYNNYEIAEQINTKQEAINTKIIKEILGTEIDPKYYDELDNSTSEKEYVEDYDTPLPRASRVTKRKSRYTYQDFVKIEDWLCWGRGYTAEPFNNLEPMVFKRTIE